MSTAEFIHWVSQPTPKARLALVVLSALCIALAMQITLTVFSWAKDSYLVHWFYPPAGVRLVLIMLFGWPAALGALFAFFLVVLPDAPETITWIDVMVLGSARISGIWGALLLYGFATRVKHPWDSLTWGHVPFLALATGLGGALAVGILRLQMEGGDADALMRQVSLSTLGDVLGIAFFLALLILLKRTATT